MSKALLATGLFLSLLASGCSKPPADTPLGATSTPAAVQGEGPSNAAAGQTPTPLVTP